MAMLTVTVTDTSSRKPRRLSINPDYIIMAKPLDWSTTNLRWERITIDIAFPTIDGGHEILHIAATPELFAALHLGKITDQ